MSISLCMIVKNEAARISSCLDSAIGAVDEVLVVDTGSVDGTPDLLKQRYGIRVVHDRLDPDRCFTLADPLNRLYARTRCDWILALDADEHLECAPGVLREATHAARPHVSGFFGAWHNHRPGMPPFEDYKLFLFRRGFRKRGLVHDNVQLDIRGAGGHAEWLEGLSVGHYPEASKLPGKLQRYRSRLRQALGIDPGWLRYPWFMGYMEYLHGAPAAWGLLDRVRQGDAQCFPVESLNARMIMTEMAAKSGNERTAALLIDEMRAVYDAVADDFEVAVNFRMPTWISRARALLDAGRPEAIEAYRFAF